MALNLRAALGICGAFIISLCYLVSQAALPVTGSGYTRISLASEELLPRFAGAVNPLEAGTRERTFARRNPFEAASPPDTSATPVLVAKVPPATQTPVVALPPRPEPEQPVLAQAAQPAPPVGKRAADWPRPLMALTPDAPAEPTQPPQVAQPSLAGYTIARGDTLSRIARREWGSAHPRLIELLLAANPPLQSRPNRVLVGEVIRIPDAATAERVLDGMSPRVALSPAPRQDGGPARLAGLQTGAQTPGTPRETLTHQWYTIRARDSLASIARRFLNDPDRWREIAEINQLPRPDRILPGMRIKLPVLTAARNS